MKAIVNERYGAPDVLELRDVEQPRVRDDGVLIRVRAASVNHSDWEGLTARPVYVRLSGAGFRKPRRHILGSDVAGMVEAVGRDVTQFQPGDEVLADTLYHGLGGFAEYVSVRESAPLVLKPEGLTWEQAAALPQAAVLGLQGLREHGGVEPGQRVLVNGAGGGAGTFAIQIAKSLGAEVTGVDKAEKLDLMRSIGADHVVDYTTEDFARGGERYDRILDFSAHRSLFTYRRALGANGVYLMVGGSTPRILQAVVLGSLMSKWGNKKLGLLIARPNKEDLSHVAGLVEGGQLAPVIERSYTLVEAPEALSHVGEGRALGKVVIRL